MTELPSVSSIAGVCCFVGSTTFRLSEADAARAYLLKNPGWPGQLGIAVIHADQPLQAGMDPERACALACLDSIAERVKNCTLVVPTLFIRNAAESSERIPICFVTVFGQSGQTKVILLNEDSIPY